MKRIRLLAAVVATLVSSLAVAQSYTVNELPAKHFVKGATVYGATSTSGIDFRGRSLIYAMAFFSDNRQAYRGEHCNAGGTRCSLLEPKDVDNGWNTLSANGRYRAGVVITAPGVSGFALRQKKGEAVEYLFCCGESRAINNYGITVGVSDNASTAWLFGTEKRSLLGLDGRPTAQALGVSDAGLVVGESRNSQFERRAVAWPAGGGDAYLLQVGIPDGLHYESSAVAVTAAGIAYGNSNYLPSHRSVKHAVRFENGNAIDLGALNADQGNASEALAVNNHGVAVGWSGNGAGPDVAALFDGSGNVFELGALIPAADRAKYAQLVFATAINDSGQILVTALKETTYETVALRLDPVKAN